MLVWRDVLLSGKSPNSEPLNLQTIWKHARSPIGAIIGTRTALIIAGFVPNSRPFFRVEGYSTPEVVSLKFSR